MASTSREKVLASKDLIPSIAKFLSPNDVACGLKHTSKAINAALSGFPGTVHLKHPTNPDLPCEPWPGQLFVAHWDRPEAWSALTLQRRRRLLGLAAASGNAASLDVVLAHCGASIDAEEALVPPAAAGCIPALERLLELPEGAESVGVVACAAAGAGQLHVLQWLHQQPEWRNDILEVSLNLTAAAARGCQGTVIDWLMQQDLVRFAALQAPMNLAMMAGALGCVPVLQVALAYTAAGDRMRVLPQVVYGCTLPVLQQYFDAMVGMATNLNQDSLELNVSVAAVSPTADWLQKIEYLQQRGAAAAEPETAAGEHPIRMRVRWTWVPQIGLQGDNREGAAYEMKAPPDYKERLQVLMARDFTLDCTSIAGAAAEGSAGLSTLQWLLDEQHYRPAAGIDIMKELCDASLSALHLLWARGTIADGQLFNVLKRWSSWRERELDLKALGALIDGVEGGDAADWGQLFHAAAVQGAPLEVLRALHERRGATVDLGAMVRGGCSVDALEWALQALHEVAATAAEQVGGSLLSAAALWGAACAGNFAAADWLCDRGLVNEPPQRAAGGAAPPPDAEWLVAQVEAAAEEMSYSWHDAVVGLTWWSKRAGHEELSPEQEELIMDLAG